MRATWCPRRTRITVENEPALTRLSRAYAGTTEALGFLLSSRPGVRVPPGAPHSPAGQRDAPPLRGNASDPLSVAAAWPAARDAQGVTGLASTASTGKHGQA
jgi:hypothetical protein